MPITVQYLGQLGDLAECGQETRSMPEDTSLVTLLKAVAAQYGETFHQIVFDESENPRSSLMVLVNDAPVDKAQPPALCDGDEVTLLAAIAGG